MGKGHRSSVVTVDRSIITKEGSMNRRIGFLLALLMMAVPFAVHGGSVLGLDEPTTVMVSETDELGQFLTDANGMTLYLFTNDVEEGVSTCYDDCEAAWPIFRSEEPLTLPEGVDGELSLVERTDGTMQVAYNGIPLYYWQGDVNPGDTTGQGVGDVWFVVAPGAQFGEAAAMMASPEASPMASPAAMGATTVLVSEDSELGPFLTDAEGNTLYLFTNDTEMGVSSCEGDCVTNWPLFQADEPLTLPEGVEGELTTIERADGESQVAYNGIPLYYFANDAAPGDTNGQGAGGRWFVVAPGLQFGETEAQES
jgi:predicted lipoprotein with Yx(FWY)xxD motif